MGALLFSSTSLFPEKCSVFANLGHFLGKSAPFSLKSVLKTLI